MKKHFEHARFEKCIAFYGDASDEQVKSGNAHPIEGKIILTVRSKKIECFDGYGESLNNFVKISPGNIIKVELVFLNFPYKYDTRIKSEIKSIVDIRAEKYGKPTGVNYYRATGQIIEISNHPKYEDSYKIVIDCGLIFTTEIGKNVPVRVGDYLKVEGRLDARFVGFDKK